MLGCEYGDTGFIYSPTGTVIKGSGNSVQGPFYIGPRPFSDVFSRIYISYKYICDVDVLLGCEYGDTGFIYIPTGTIVKGIGSSASAAFYFASRPISGALRSIYFMYTYLCGGEFVLDGPNNDPSLI